MTLDEAIEHAKQVANTCDNSECAANHMQLAEWLRRARGADKAARWYTNRIQKLEDENAKLRKERDTCRDLVDYMVHTDIPDQLAAENVRLREMLAENNEELAKMGRVIDYLRFFAKARGVDAEDMCERGVEVDE